MVRAGLAIHLCTVEKLANGVTPVGAEVDFVVAEDVLDTKNEILIRRGAPASGKCVESLKPPSLVKAGKLSFTVDSVVAVDGTSIPLKLEQKRQGAGVVAAVTGGLQGLAMSGHNV